MLKEVFDTPERAYTFYYDESNNVRKLYINEGDDSYNIDNDKAKAAATNFMLAGVAHKGSESSAEVERLFSGLQLQPSSKELKFKHVARGDFFSVLKSTQVRTILRWLLESDLYVHYFNLNIEYWSFIDIVDDCVLHCLENERLTFQGDAHFRYYLDYHKDFLLRLIRENRMAFIATVKRYGYPSFNGRERDFLSALRGLISQHTIEAAASKSQEGGDDLMGFKSLDELLELSLDIEEMALTLGPEENMLIDGLSVFYQHRAQSFPNSTHIFDEENEVEEAFLSMTAHSYMPLVRGRFVKSMDSPLTQLSDVVAGLFARYFNFIERNALEEMEEMRRGFNHVQRENIGLIRSLVEKTDAECPHMLLYVMSMREHERHRMFMFS